MLYLSLNIILEITSSKMWQKNLLRRITGYPTNIFGCNQHLTFQKFSNTNKIENTDEFSSTSEDNIERLLNDAATFSEATDTSWESSPYPDKVKIPVEEPLRPVQDPSTASIILFPGQGTLKVGSIRKYLHTPRAKEIFEIANSILGFDLLKICLEGPQAKLNRTEFNQIATVATSLAAMEKVREERPMVIDQCKAAVGYSVGELTALILSGAISLEDGIRLAGVRGAAMQQASDSTPQGMLLIRCLPQANVRQMCEMAQKWAMNMGVSEALCEVAIYIFSEGRVVAGNEEALKYIEANYKRFGIIHPQRLSVSGAFHTPLMEPAIKSFKTALSQVQFYHPKIDVYSNYSAKIYRKPEDIKKLLLKQIISPMKWEQIMHSIYSRMQDSKFPRTFEVGSQGSLKSILKRINLKAAKLCQVI